MNSYLLKIIAIISMTFDHYSVITGEDQWMRIVGRLSFPIFAFLLGEGYKHTRKNANIGKDNLPTILIH